MPGFPSTGKSGNRAQGNGKIDSVTRVFGNLASVRHRVLRGRGQRDRRRRREERDYWLKGKRPLGRVRKEPLGGVRKGPLKGVREGLVGRVREELLRGAQKGLVGGVREWLLKEREGLDQVPPANLSKSWLYAIGNHTNS